MYTGQANQITQKTEELLRAALNGDLEKVKSMIENQGIDINLTDSSGATALHCAASQGHNEVVEYLVSRGANVDPKTKGSDNRDDNITPLYSAVQHGQKGAAGILLNKKAKIDVIVNGYTILQIAAMTNKTEIIDLLLSHGIDVNDSRGKDNNTALHTAIQKEKHESIKCLLDKGACYKQCAKGGHNALHFAALKGDGLIKLLLEYVEKKVGKEELQKYVNLSAEDGRTGLHIAALREDYYAVKRFLENGANLREKDKEGNKAYDCVKGSSSISRQIKELLNHTEEKLAHTEGKGQTR